MIGIKSILKRTPFYGYYFARTRAIPVELDDQDLKILNLYSQFVRDGSLVFDVGANVGFRTKIFRHLNCRVVAIEPHRHCVAALKHSFGKSITVVQAAASDREGYADLHMSDVTAISTISNEWVDTITKSGRFGDMKWTDKERTRLVRLDTLISKYGLPDFIKIDVEGHEPAVLKGLSARAPSLSFEFTPIAIGSAVACINKLCSLGDYLFNFSQAETGELMFREWVDSEAIVRALADIEHETYGDIYARLSHRV